MTPARQTAVVEKHSLNNFWSQLLVRFPAKPLNHHFHWLSPWFSPNPQHHFQFRLLLWSTSAWSLIQLPKPRWHSLSNLYLLTLIIHFLLSTSSNAFYVAKILRLLDCLASVFSLFDLWYSRYCHHPVILSNWSNVQRFIFDRLAETGRRYMPCYPNDNMNLIYWLDRIWIKN